MSSVMGVVQSDVIDELGRGWPELHDKGVFSGILEPGVGADGTAVCANHGTAVCAIGRLDRELGSQIAR